ncbi:MAG: 1-deoxy-D-xylulose-5-phosphate reductoisomerase [Oscillospiraceae bacterium]|nr:1-deoxy-D-xylulose-5-phosphate reductoisomerase [Oscillospiraceae bacterium]
MIGELKRNTNDGDYDVFAICANNNTALLEEQARKFKPEYCAVYDENKAGDLKIKLRDTQTKVLAGMDGINFISEHNKTDFVINALTGQIGLEPTLNAIRAKKNIGLANKETLVAAGDIVVREAEINGVDILPVDSEHCAVFQCLAGEENNKIDKIILTASGGPFYGRNRKDLENVTVKDALNHPTWKMGKKITVDSATMMNKGLELIEACYLFDVSPDNIDIVIHRESIVHSLAQFEDKSVKAQMSLPDMKMCIQYAITGANNGKRQKSLCGELDLTKIKNLSFAEPDNETFTFPELARSAVKRGGTLPAVMNAANEVCVDLFLREKIRFTDIFDFVREAVEKHKNTENPGIENIIYASNDIKRHFLSRFA